MELFALVIWILFLVLIYKKAEQYKRSKFIWVVLGVVISPILAIIALLILGENREQ